MLSDPIVRPFVSVSIWSNAADIVETRIPDHVREHLIVRSEPALGYGDDEWAEENSMLTPCSLVY